VDVLQPKKVGMFSMNMLGCAVVIGLIFAGLIAQQLLRSGYNAIGIILVIFVLLFCLWIATRGGGGGSGGEGNNPNNM